MRMRSIIWLGFWIIEIVNKILLLMESRLGNSFMLIWIGCFFIVRLKFLNGFLNKILKMILLFKQMIDLLFRMIWFESRIKLDFGLIGQFINWKWHFEIC